MKQLSSFTLVTLLAVTLSFTACTSETTIAVEEETTEATVDEQTSGVITVSFSFGTSSASRATGKAAARDEESDEETVTTEELQTDEEKAVNKLIAVVFMDTDSGVANSGETSGEADDDTFTTYQYILGSSTTTEALVEGTSYDITIPVSEGQYQLCFVANPSEAMEACITGDGSAEDALTSESTIADFKALVETQDPGTKPMTMTSTYFFGVTTDESADLGTVLLERIMSRIDIINLAEGITVDKAILYNRTEKSMLINDKQSSGTTSEFLATDGAEYDFSTTACGGYALVGNPDDTSGTSAEELGTDGHSSETVNASKATIYSYEQYEEDTNIPYIDIYYHLGTDADKTYIHTVKFITTETDESGNETESAIYFKRNNCYRIFLSYETGDFTASITVADWTEETALTVSSYDLGLAIDDEYGFVTDNPSVGDFMMSDGQIVSATTMAMSASNTYAATGTTYGESAVAIVYYVEETSTSSAAKVVSRDDSSTSRMGDTISDFVDGNGYKVHGKAMALKDCSSTYKWRSSKSSVSELSNFLTPAAAYGDYDGYSNTLVVESLSAYSSSTFPAFYQVVNYSPSAPENTTSWYLPSYGEFMDFLSYLGGVGGENWADIENTSDDRGSDTSSDVWDPIKESINEALSLVGEGNYDVIGTAGTYFWTSTQHNSGYARVANFQSNGTYRNGYQSKTTSNYCRAALAF